MMKYPFNYIVRVESKEEEIMLQAFLDNRCINYSVRKRKSK